MKEISIKNLSFSYQDNSDRLILKDINLDIKEGEFVCLLGQSGCGKSTLLRLLCGLEKPTKGSITIDGEEIKGTGLDRAVVFQDYGLFPWMTAGENIMLALTQKYGKRKSDYKNKVFELLAQVGLDPQKVYNTLPKGLSGGMKQRCAIARALALDSPIMLMDEPFGALDAVTRSKLQDLVYDLVKHEKTKKTIFFVTHDVDEALLLANRIVVLGQSPSKIIYELTIPEEKRATRENQFSNVDVLNMRNELIKQINLDIRNRIS